MKHIIAAFGVLLLVPASALAQAQPQPAAPTAYHVSPGDVLDIYVWGEEKLQRTLTVLPDGSFAFPLAGTVIAAGKTPPQIEAELSRLLAGQFKGVAPQVTASVKTPSGMQVSVIGKVKAPGTFSPTRYINVLEALAMAGGSTDFADVGNIVILRHIGDRTTVVRARLASILKGRPSDEDLTGNGVPQLVAGDTVIVP